VAALRELPGSFVIDGEAVAHCPEDLPDFHRLLVAMASAPRASMPSTFCT
jgi:ATP-dependent DNA ligase